MHLSVVIPALNEAHCIGGCLAPLQPLRERGHEVIVVDGGSSDGTRDIASGLADQVLTSDRGRARQLNCGAAAATGNMLLFLHADTVLPAAADGTIAETLAGSRTWGWFRVRLSGAHPLFRVIEFMMNLRSAASGIATGDQGLVVTRALFDACGGYRDLALMEDVDLCARLKRRGPGIALSAVVTTSSRRWETRGIVRTVFLMWWLRLRFALGADPDALARRYG